MEARVEALMENLAMAVMQADHLAQMHPSTECWQETLAYGPRGPGALSAGQCVRFSRTIQKPSNHSSVLQDGVSHVEEAMD